MKKFISFLVLVLVLTGLTACGPEDNGPSDELVKDKTINVYSWWDPTHDGLVRLKAGFEEKYKDYNAKINFVKISSYYQTMLTKLAGAKLAGGSSEQIDVMMLASDKIPLFAANKTIMSLDDFVTDDYLNDLYPSVKEGLYFEDSIYAVARDVTTKAMILNKTVFETYDIDLPDEDWTVDDFEEICLEFAKETDNVWGYSFDANPDPLYVSFYLFGGEYFDSKTNVSLVDTKGSVDGVTFLYDLMQAGGAMTLSETLEYGGFVPALKTGYAAMISGGVAQANEAENAGADIVVRPLPIGTSGKHQSHTFLNCWTIPSVTSNSAWAWKVLEYFSGPEGQAIVCDAGMGLPGSSTADIADWLAEKPYRQYFVDALDYEGAMPFPTATFGPSWQTNFKTLMSDNIWDKPGLTHAQIKTELEKLNDKLTYILMGGS
ncbi:MAG: extracellular solute-binding protein [Bacilli bacterium]|nr:extracellular solute-binding protein [Bacilli bacterium]